MISLILFSLAVLATILHHFIKKKEKHPLLETFLAYLIFFNIGVMGLLAFYAHTFMAAETARSIGWAPGSPFQFEIAMANLAFGVLGLLGFWLRGSFWIALIIGVSIFLLGDLVGHLYQYKMHGDVAPNNMGLFVWINDLILPFLYLTLLGYYLYSNKKYYTL